MIEETTNSEEDFKASKDLRTRDSVRGAEGHDTRAVMPSIGEVVISLLEP